jgi:hypothetical protein
MVPLFAVNSGASYFKIAVIFSALVLSFNSRTPFSIYNKMVPKLKMSDR